MSKEKLTHLSTAQIDGLIERYYAGERVSDLIQEFKIDSRASALVSLFPLKVYSNLECPYCEGENLVQKLKSRDSYSQGSPHCPVCSHKDEEGCRCSNCHQLDERRREQEEAIKRDIIRLHYSINERDCPTASELSFRDSVYLLALFRHSVTEEMDLANPFSERQPELAPTFDLQKEVVKHLYAKGLVAPSVHSSADAFIFNDELSNTTAYYPTRVSWAFLPGVALEKKQELLSDLHNLASDGDWAESQQQGISFLWGQITKFECIEYYLYLLEQRGFELENIGPKTHAVFEGLLERFSVAQIYNLTLQAVRDTTDYIVRENLPSYRAKNSFIGAVQRKADKYIAEGWTLRSSRRDFNCPQTVLSSTFFDTFLRLGAKTFEQVRPN